MVDWIYGLDVGRRQRCSAALDAGFSRDAAYASSQVRGLGDRPYRGGSLLQPRADLRIMRLDTGDLRYRYMGIPIVYERMPEPQRSRLLRLTQGSRVCAPTWEQCASFPLHTSNNPDAMCRGFYMRIDAWIDVDKKLALAGVEDIARYIIETNGRRGLPRSTPLLFKTEWSDDRTRTMRVEEGWQADAGIAEYRKSVGN